MYTEIGEVSCEVLAELRALADASSWERHDSEVTSHLAADCTKEINAVTEISNRFPWTSATLMRLEPGGKLYRHCDSGIGITIPIETNDAAFNVSYDGTRREHRLKAGKIYHTDRSVEHEAFNPGDSNRTYLLLLG